MPSCLLQGVPRKPLRPLVAALAPTSIKLDWSSVLNPNSDCWCGWYLFRSIGSGSPQLVFSGPHSLTVFADTELPASSNIKYYIVAKNLAGNSTDGDILAVTTPAPAPPAAVSALVFEYATNTSLTVSWRPPNNNGDPITQYDLEWVSNATGVVIVQGAQYPSSSDGSWTYSNSSWMEQTYYTLRIRARNSQGNGNWSALFAFPTTATNATAPARPNPPTIVNATVESIELGFDPVDPAGGTLLSFEVQMKWGSLNFFTIGSGERVLERMNVTGLNATTVYTFRVRVRTSVGYSRYSTGVDANVMDCTYCSSAHGLCKIEYPNNRCECEEGWSGQGCTVSSLSSALVESDYPYMRVLEPSIDYRMYWRFQNENIEIALRAKTTGWIGWGIAPQATISKAIKGCETIQPTISSDQYIFWVNDKDGQVFGADFYNHDFSVLCLDSEFNGTKNILALNGYQEGDVTTIKFLRKMWTGDAHDLPLSKTGTMFLAWAVGQADPLDETQVEQHKATSQSRGYVSLDLSGTKIQSTVTQSHSIAAAIFIIFFGADVLLRRVRARKNNPALLAWGRHVVTVGWLVCVSITVISGVWTRDPSTTLKVHAVLGWISAIVAALSSVYSSFLEARIKLTPNLPPMKLNVSSRRMVIARDIIGAGVMALSVLAAYFGIILTPYHIWLNYVLIAVIGTFLLAFLTPYAARGCNRPEASATK